MWNARKLTESLPSPEYAARYADFKAGFPDEAWDDPQVARLFDDLSHNLELGERHKAMLHKLSAVEHGCESAIDLWHGRRSNALEWAIVLLIVVEIVLAAVGYV